MYLTWIKQILKRNRNYFKEMLTSLLKLPTIQTRWMICFDSRDYVQFSSKSSVKHIARNIFFLLSFWSKMVCRLNCIKYEIRNRHFCLRRRVFMSDSHWLRPNTKTDQNILWPLFHHCHHRISKQNAQYINPANRQSIPIFFFLKYQWSYYCIIWSIKISSVVDFKCNNVHGIDDVQILLYDKKCYRMLLCLLRLWHLPNLRGIIKPYSKYVDCSIGWA